MGLRASDPSDLVLDRGLPGAFIAIPMLATFKIFSDHIESLAAVGDAW